MAGIFPRAQLIDNPLLYPFALERQRFFQGKHVKKIQRQEVIQLFAIHLLARPRIAAGLPVNIRAALQGLDIFHGVKKK